MMINNVYNLDNGFLDNSTGCSQPVLSINDQQNNLYVISGTVTIFKVCGYPNADFIIQDMGIGGSGEGRVEGRGGDVNLFYPYDVIDRGKLDSDGIYIFSTPLNKVGTYAFRAGIWCTVADIDYCTKVSNAVMVTVLEKECTSNWQCKQPLDGYEYDANYCGGIEKIASRCNPECGGVGCEGDSEDNKLLKIGAVVAVVGAIAYYTSRNGFRVRLRNKKR